MVVLLLGWVIQTQEGALLKKEIYALLGKFASQQHISLMGTQMSLSFTEIQITFQAWWYTRKRREIKNMF